MSDNTKTEEQAFAEAFAAISAEQETSSLAPEHREEPAPVAEAEGDQQTGSQEQPAAPEDPFAALPQAVRDELAKVQRLQHELEAQSRQIGMIKGLQKEIARLQQQITPREQPAAPKLEKVERLRQDLPEFAEALDEVLQHTRTAPEPAQPAAEEAPAPRNEPEVDPVIASQIETLNEVRPDWQATFKSTDYLLWLGRQAPGYQAEVKSTAKAAVILRSLRDFDQFAQGLTKAKATQQNRLERIAGAAAPTAPARRGRQAPTDEESAFLQGFRAVSGG